LKRLWLKEEGSMQIITDPSFFGQLLLEDAKREYPRPSNCQSVNKPGSTKEDEQYFLQNRTNHLSIVPTGAEIMKQIMTVDFLREWEI
jgi:hypothetical protein